jgi:hypothetical protein
MVFNRVVIPAVERYCLAPYRADRDTEPGSVSVQTFQALASCRVVICDLTGVSPNVMYELGVTHAANLPVILLCSDAEQLPFYARDERIIPLGDGTDAAYDQALHDLDAALGKVLAETYAPRSVVGQTLGLSGPYPPALRRVIHGAERPLYREAMTYDLKVHDVNDEHLEMRMGHSYRLVNRTRVSYSQVVGIVPMRPFKPVYGRLGDSPLDIDDPDQLTERGWRVQHEFPAESVTEVEFVADVNYRMPDSDVFATYLPATSFELTLRYPPESVRVVVESLLPSPVFPERLASDLVAYRPPRALRAYEGFKIDWLRPK